MRKATIITIGGVAFYLENDAFQLLERYLASIGDHYNDSPDKQEIVDDIELRFAEYFSDYVKTATQTITTAQVQEVMDKIGSVEDFDASKDSPNVPAAEPKRRLYRDSENAVVGGVAAGLGAYFETDPVLFRLAFVILTLFGGSGAILYLAFLIAVPEAKTADERLNMKGKPIDLDAITEQIRSTVTSDATRTTLSKAGSVVRQVWDNLQGFLGVALTVVGIVGLVGLGIALTGGYFSPNISGAAREAIALLGTRDAVLLGVGVLGVVLLPLLTLIGLGERVFQRRTLGAAAITVTTVLWFALATTTVALLSRHETVVNQFVSRVGSF